MPTRTGAAQPDHRLMHGVQRNPPHFVDKVNAALPHDYITFSVECHPDIDRIPQREGPIFEE
ncbi:MAG TPA: hypothetical protein EYM54_12290 [Dehalococcoidia bacterium]|nr:hypothetical protein [Dehalococcoidia bacterium]